MKDLIMEDKKLKKQISSTPLRLEVLKIVGMLETKPLKVLN